MKAILLLSVTLLLSATCFSQTTKVIPDDDKSIIFIKAEYAPHFPGGDTAWQAYLQKNMNTAIVTSNGAPKGNYRVDIRFIVHVDSTVSDFTSETEPGYGIAAEAIRLIKNGPKWIPAIQNGYRVNCYMRQSFVFKAD